MPETLVLIPGFASDARLFEGQLPALSRRTGVLVAGIARAERIEEMASEVLSNAPQRFALAGQGLGGMVALEILRRASERVTRVALISTSPQAETPPEASAREPQVVAARSGRLAEVLREIASEGGFAGSENRLPVMNKLVQMGQDLGPEGVVRHLRALQRRRDQQPVLRALEKPALVVCGAHDTKVPRKRQEVAAELIPHGELRVIEEAGHVPSLEAPEALTEILLELLDMPARR